MQHPRLPQFAEKWDFQNSHTRVVHSIVTPSAQQTSRPVECLGSQYGGSNFLFWSRGISLVQRMAISEVGPDFANVRGISIHAHVTTDVA